MIKNKKNKTKKKWSDYQQYFNVRTSAMFHFRGDCTSVTDEYIPLYSMLNAFTRFLDQKRGCKQKGLL